MILVLGSNGLLGSAICKLYYHDTIGLSRQDLDMTDFVTLRKTINSILPDTIINCVGVVPKAHNQTNRHTLNTVLPHVLVEHGMLNDVRVIHVSTDCVFDGKRGGYVESDPPSATDPYGISKAHGEFYVSNHLLVRTSFVGLPDPNGRGLLAALQHNRNSAMPAHENVLWNGVTVDTLADILVDVAYDKSIDGVKHVYSPRAVSKAQLLTYVNEIYKFNVKLVGTKYPKMDRTLMSEFQPQWEWPPTIYQQIIRMKQRLAFNE